MINSIIKYKNREISHPILIRVLLLIVFIVSSLDMICQNQMLSNKVYHHIEGVKDTTLIEAQTIVPSSLNWHSSNESLEIEYELKNNILHLSNLQGSDVWLSYRVFDFDIQNSISILDSLAIRRDERIMLLNNNQNNSRSRNAFIQSGDLNYRGSFTRGISFGNTQDLVLNSNLNLQMSGDLGNGLKITAAISDDNIPLQAEGNTQILQEFNKVFIEVQKDNISVVAGDYELGSGPNGSHFMRYFKKLKGLSVESRHKLKDDWTITNKASFAVSRGKFRRIELLTRESNQGPYKLDGENGELFLQVLSGTEKIYADGRLLQRGENNDYIIDYNRAEIRFTPKLIITANIRIIVEFEYSVQNYLRSLYATQTQISNDKWDFKLNLYSEQDSKTTSGNIELDSTDLRILEEGGDTDNFRSGIYPLDGSSLNDDIAYHLDMGVLRYTLDDSLDIFGARFSNFGENKGDYVIDQEAASNGRVYKYVGKNMGSYLPLIELIAPEKRQMFSASSQYNISDSTHLFFETAVSNRDLNKFSSIDDEDNTSVALTGRISDIRKIGSSNSWTLYSTINYELQKKNFEILNPYRSAEFIRDWNLASLQENNDQHLISGEFKILKDKNWIQYRLTSFTDIDIYKGTRQNGEIKIEEKTWYFKANSDWLNSEYSNEKTDFIRPRISLNKGIFNGKLEIGSYFEKEMNKTTVDQDSLSPLSFDYELYRFYIRSKKDENKQFQISFSNRIDKRRLDNNILEKTTESKSFEVNGNLDNSQNSKLNWQIVLRQYDVQDKYLEKDNPNKSLIGNIDHKLSLFNSGLLLSSFYESNSGQEPKIEFQFVKVQTGEGSYVWNDYNLDSIQQINEFEISPFSDLASYEKISVFNNEFISTKRYILNQSIRIDPKKFMKTKGNVLSRIYLMSKYRIDQKNENTESNELLSFINFDLNSPELVSFNSSFDHNLYINRGDPVWDIHIAYRRINNKILQITGFEQFNKDEYFSRFRFNMKRKTDLILEAKTGDLRRNSENFTNQNYTIQNISFSPQINHRPSAKFRAILKFLYEKKENILGSDNESADILNNKLELSWRQNSTSNLEFEFSYVSIDYTGSINTPIEFEMLQGLKDGTNLLWGLNYIRRVSDNIELLINYNGRKSASNPAINIASIQMRAIF